MTKELSNQQAVAWNLLRRHYQELKTKRNDLKAEYLRQVERDMAVARDNFAAEVQEAFEDHDLSIADIMRAMGTTSRNTVNAYLQDARERKVAAMVEKPVLPYELLESDSVTFGSPSRTMVWAVVYDGENYWTAEQMGKSTIDVYVTDPGNTIVSEYAKTGAPKPYALPLTTDAPGWLTWLVKQDEWIEKVALLG